jgi:hypothetical protein
MLHVCVTGVDDAAVTIWTLSQSPGATLKEWVVSLQVAAFVTEQVKAVEAPFLYTVIVFVLPLPFAALAR